MKSILNSIIACALLCTSLNVAMAQESKTEVTSKVPISVYVPEESCDIPVEAQNALNTKLMTAAAQNGMGATSDFTQFCLSYTTTKTGMQVLPGAPTKYRQEIDITLYIVDVMSKKIFNATTFSTHAVGNSETKAYIACFNQLSSSNKNLKSFLVKTNKDIVDYYEGQIDNIIAIAESLAKVYKYEEALFRLSLVPDVCPSYHKVLEVATGIFQKYIVDEAKRNLAKARAIWNAGLDFAAAAESAEYLALILPEASCYEDAMALSQEIKERVGSDIQYYRDLESRDADRAHEISMAQIDAWRQIGVSYGNNQRDTYYNTPWVF